MMELFWEHMIELFVAHIIFQLQRLWCEIYNKFSFFFQVKSYWIVNGVINRAALLIKIWIKHTHWDKMWTIFQFDLCWMIRFIADIRRWTFCQSQKTSTKEIYKIGKKCLKETYFFFPLNYTNIIDGKPARTLTENFHLFTQSNQNLHKLKIYKVTLVS